MRLPQNFWTYFFGLAFSLALAFCFHETLDAREFPGTKTDWNGFDCYNFVLDGRNARVVAPKEPAPGKPWIWRAVFFGHEPQTEIAMLHKGWYVAWISTSDLLGSDKCNQERSNLYNFLTEEYGLNPKPVLLGMSRGGLCSLRWAIANPDKVSALYIDAPVCDLKSWPGGKGKGVGSPQDWAQAQQVYGLSEEQLLNFDGMPIVACKTLAERKIPILLIAGDADRVVPYDENGAILVENYQKVGGPIEVIIKPGVDHHPHSLKDPARIVDFIEKHAPQGNF
ncbi:MAG: prolyl oligopeptidase family serine peptidase [Planctomycetia bacterium]|nr:prolyl oligopeptidase family serine peptidase [Planctomycetia bacterium]